MLTVCSERLEKDEDLRQVVMSHNKSDMYAWFQTTVLHVWLCLGRMYTPPLDHRELMSQEMSNHLFSLVESKLVAHGVTNPLAFNREYRRLAQIFHGTCVAYDKAYASQDDEQLARAIWRNWLNQDREDEQRHQQQHQQLQCLVTYVKKQKLALKFADPEKFSKGQVVFLQLKETMKNKD